VGSLFRDSFVVAQQQQSNAAAPDSEAPNSVFFQFPLCSGVVPSARWAHSACLVGSLMFVYGGVGSSVMDDLWMLDIETMVWRVGSTTVSRPKDRPEKMLAHACAASGKTIWFFGGQQGRKFLREVYSLNTETMAWKLHSTDAPAARAGHSMTTVGPMEILTLGGQGKKLYNDLWLFNAGTVGWTELKPSGTPPSARRGQSAVWDGEDRLIVYGGTLASGGDSKVYIYSRSSNSWVTVTPSGEAPPTRTNHSAALLPGSGMVVFGGCR
jgi:N-acetylneuraminic acid mutarotase